MNTIKRWLRAGAWWTLGHIHPTDPEIDQALRSAYVDAGVSLDLFYDEYVLGPKLHEVLLHAFRHTGNGLVTLGDVRRAVK